MFLLCLLGLSLLSLDLTHPPIAEGLSLWVGQPWLGAVKAKAGSSRSAFCVELLEHTGILARDPEALEGAFSRPSDEVFAWS